MNPVTSTSAGGYTNGVNGMAISGLSFIGGGQTGNQSTAASYSGPFASQKFFGEPIAFWLGLILLLFGLKFLSERVPASGLNPADIKIGGYNFLAVGVCVRVPTR